MGVRCLQWRIPGLDRVGKENMFVPVGDCPYWSLVLGSLGWLAVRSSYIIYIVSWTFNKLFILKFVMPPLQGWRLSIEGHFVMDYN